MYLAWAVYPDPSWRYMTDLDFLVQRADLARLKEVMHDLGYIRGEVSADHRRVTPISREVEGSVGHGGTGGPDRAAVPLVRHHPHDAVGG
jgi:hypothetical protein